MFQITYPDDDGTNADSDAIAGHHQCEDPQPAKSTGLTKFWVFIHAIIALVS